MENIVSRRKLLLSAGALVVSGLRPLLSGDASNLELVNSTIAQPTPEQTEGPFYIERQIMRSNICEDRIGVPVELKIEVIDALTMKPCRNSAVDIWHCDASGKYSGFAVMAEIGMPPGGPPSARRLAFGHPFMTIPGRRPDVTEQWGANDLAGLHFPPGAAPLRPKLQPTDTTTFLRGTQITDENGVVRYKTIYPGWYAGRALHMHLKVHCGGELIKRAQANENAKDIDLTGTSGMPTESIIGYRGGHVSHTGQLFFPEHESDAVGLTRPYANSKTTRVSLGEDMIFLSEEGKACMVQLVSTSTNIANGFVASARLIIDPSATPQPV